MDPIKPEDFQEKPRTADRLPVTLHDLVMNGHNPLPVMAQMRRDVIAAEEVGGGKYLRRRRAFNPRRSGRPNRLLGAAGIYNMQKLLLSLPQWLESCLELSDERLFTILLQNITAVHGGVVAEVNLDDGNDVEDDDNAVIPTQFAHLTLDYLYMLDDELLAWSPHMTTARAKRIMAGQKQTPLDQALQQTVLLKKRTFNLFWHQASQQQVGVATGIGIPDLMEIIALYADDVGINDANIAALNAREPFIFRAAGVSPSAHYVDDSAAPIFQKNQEQKDD
jgi:hypothetical protein